MREKGREKRGMREMREIREMEMIEREGERDDSKRVGCNKGGRGGFFSKVKRLVASWIGTRKRLFSSFLTAPV